MTVLTARELDAPYPYVVSEDAVHDVIELLRATSESGAATSVLLLGPEIAGPRSILDLEGLGKEIWQGVDAKRYIDELRDEWEHR